MTQGAIDWIAREKMRYPGNCWVVPYPYTHGHFRVEGCYHELSDEAFYGFVEEMRGMETALAGPSQAATVVRSALRANANAPVCLTPGIRIGLRRAMDYLRRPDGLWAEQTLRILRAQNAAALRTRAGNTAIYALARALSLGMEYGACRADGYGRNL